MRLTQQQRIVISMSCYKIYIELLTYVKLYVTLILRAHIMQCCIQAFNTGSFSIFSLNEKQYQNLF